MSSTTYLYWLRLPEHTDPLSEGYIGISRNPDTRYKAHISNTGNFYLKRDTAVFSVLHEYPTREDAFAAEEEMRPTSYIGWNRAPGGQYMQYHNRNGKPPRGFPDYRNPNCAIKPVNFKPTKDEKDMRLFNFRGDCDILDKFQQICKGNDVSAASMLKQYMQQEIDTQTAQRKPLFIQQVSDEIYI